MKKFFSLVCALAILLSASAVPAKVLGKSKQAEAMEAVKTVKEKKIHCNLMKQNLIKRKHKLCLETQLLIIFYENTLI